MGSTSDLLVGLAQLLEDGGVGAWQQDGTYPADALTIIKISDLGGDAPAGTTQQNIVSLTPYPVSDDPTLSESVQGVQVRLRGSRDPRSVDDLDDLVFDLLQGLGPVTLNGVRVELAVRRGGTPLGPDANGRHQRSSNYHLTVFRPSRHRT